MVTMLVSAWVWHGHIGWGGAGCRLPAHKGRASQGHEVHLAGTARAHRGKEHLEDVTKRFVLWGGVGKAGGHRVASLDSTAGINKNSNANWLASDCCLFVFILSYVGIQTVT